MEGSDERNHHHTVKRKRGSNNNGDDSSAVANGDVHLSLLEEIEKSRISVEALDIKTVKKLVLSFERRLKDNIAARLKYPDQPEKFADSEVELHEEIEKLKILAGAPELYSDLVNLNVIPSILDLLTHDNTDIAIDVVGLLQDLTEQDVLDENDEPAQVLVDCLIENNVLESLVQNLLRLSESDPDEVAAVYSTLSTIENFIEVKPAVAEMVCERTKLLRWIIGNFGDKSQDIF